MKERQQSLSDLLALRDGEPLDGPRAVEASGDPRASERLQRLRALKADLQSLPALEPDPENLARIRARLAAPRPRRGGYPEKALLASAAALTLAVLVSFLMVERDVPMPSTAELRPSAEPQGTPAVTGSAVLERSGDLSALQQVSFRLEGLARAVPGGIGTGQPLGDPAESALLYRLADLDGQLSQGADREGLDAETERALWARRVELLGTLTRVRQINATRQVAYY